MAALGDGDVGRISSDSSRKEGRGIGGRARLSSGGLVISMVSFTVGVLGCSPCVASLPSWGGWALACCISLVVLLVAVVPAGGG